MGMVILPILTERFMEIYGWRGSLFLIAAINFHIFVAALLMKVPNDPGVCGGLCYWFKKDAITPNIPKTPIKIDTRKRENAENTELTSFQGDIMRSGQKRHSISETSFVQCSTTDNSSDEMVAEKSTRKSGVSNDSGEKNKVVQLKKCRHYSNESTQSHGNAKLSERDLSQRKRQKERSFENSTNDEGRDGENSIVKQVKRVFGDIRSPCVDYPVLFPFALARLTYGLISNGAIIFLVPAAIDKGLSVSTATYLSSLFGLGDFLGRFLIGILVSKLKMNSLKTNIFMTLMNALTFLVYPLLNRFSVFAVIAFFNGFFLGADGSMGLIIMNDALPKKLFKFGTGLLYLSYGIGAPLGGLLAGNTSFVHSPRFALNL